MFYYAVDDDGYSWRDTTPRSTHAAQLVTTETKERYGCSKAHKNSFKWKISLSQAIFVDANTVLSLFLFRSLARLDNRQFCAVRMSSILPIHNFMERTTTTTTTPNSHRLVEKMSVFFLFARSVSPYAAVCFAFQNSKSKTFEWKISTSSTFLTFWRVFFLFILVDCNTKTTSTATNKKTLQNIQKVDLDVCSTCNAVGFHSSPVLINSIIKLKKISFIAIQSKHFQTARERCVRAHLSITNQLAHGKKRRNGPRVRARANRRGKKGANQCIRGIHVLVLTFGNYMRFDLLRVKSAYSMVYVSISLAFHPYGCVCVWVFAMLLLFHVAFFSSFVSLLWLFFYKLLNGTLSCYEGIANVICKRRTELMYLCCSVAVLISHDHCSFGQRDTILRVCVCVRRANVTLFFRPTLRLSINQLRIHYYYFSYGIIVYKNKADKVDVTTRLAINFIYFSDCVKCCWFFSLSSFVVAVVLH